MKEVDGNPPPSVLLGCHALCCVVQRLFWRLTTIGQIAQGRCHGRPEAAHLGIVWHRMPGCG